MPITDSRRRSFAIMLVSVAVPAVLAQAPSAPTSPRMVDLAGSWAMSNDEELLTRIDPGPGSDRADYSEYTETLGRIH